jgi:putative ABC transport system permease protein
MLKNYLIVAFRNLNRTRAASAVSIIGLAVGMAASLLIWHYVTFEKSYDRFHADNDRIYRLRYERTDGSGLTVKFASCTPPAAARIRERLPEVEKIGRLLDTQGMVSYGDTQFLEERVFYAEPEFLDVLKFEFVSGDPITGLQTQNNACISESTARKYFGEKNPLGETINIDRRTDYKIVGVFKDIPENSHLKFDILLPWVTLAAKMGTDYTESWGETGAFTYLRLAPGVNPQAFESKLAELVTTECPWLKDYQMTIDLKMQPLTDIHLNSHFMQEYETNGNAQSVEYLRIIAIFIMVMAWVNFVSMSTAGATSRAKEVGLRKVVGASRRQLAGQFFFELAVINGLAGLIAIALIATSLPWFNHMIGLPASYYPWLQGWFWPALGMMLLVGVFLSGLYPVIVLSSFEPVTVLKGFLARRARGFNLRKVFVVFQFAVAAALITATVTVFRQIDFMRNQDLGFAIDQTLVVRAPRVRTAATYGGSVDSFKEILAQQGGINKVAHVTEVPGKQIYWDAGGIRRAEEDPTLGKNYQIVGVDYDFADLFELKFVAGRNFSKDFPADQQGLLLNETAVRQMGFKDPASAIGEKVNYWDEIFTVIGVVKDYHQQSPKMAFEPHLYRYAPYGRGSMGAFAIKITGDDVRGTVAKVQQLYTEFFPGNSFEYFFLDDYFNQQYASDMLFGKVYGLFTLLAVIIIVLGIYGLSSYTVARLTKEIGIRKVLGASVASIVRLLTREYVVLIVLANVIAGPVAWYFMNHWLEGFANRTQVGVMPFLLAIVATLVVAMLTVSYKVVRAAVANPVKAIRYE